MAAWLQARMASRSRCHRKGVPVFVLMSSLSTRKRYFLIGSLIDRHVCTHRDLIYCLERQSTWCSCVLSVLRGWTVGAPPTPLLASIIAIIRTPRRARPGDSSRVLAAALVLALAPASYRRVSAKSPGLWEGPRLRGGSVWCSPGGGISSMASSAGEADWDVWAYNDAIKKSATFELALSLLRRLERSEVAPNAVTYHGIVLLIPALLVAHSGSAVGGWL